MIPPVEPRGILVVGDRHADSAGLGAAIEQARGEGCEVLLSQLGDTVERPRGTAMTAIPF